VSAPPGYSEHHTGYALDIGDAKAANTDLEFSERFSNLSILHPLAGHVQSDLVLFLGLLSPKLRIFPFPSVS
jgi:hypothetical protein